MKHTALILLALNACFPSPREARGAVACAMDSNCPDGYHCGFVHLDETAVCVYDGPPVAPGAVMFTPSGHMIDR